jgi:hypothetical protein
MGTITGISDLDPVRWPNSHWRSVKVGLETNTALFFLMPFYMLSHFFNCVMSEFRVRWWSLLSYI